MREKHGVLAAPCKSCPYRKDVPSGVWGAEEYEKLAAYDGEIIEQVMKGATSLFLCHQKNNCLCSGWLACHGPDNLVAMRLHYSLVKPEAYEYETSVPLFSSGAEAAEHGMRELEQVGKAAKRVMAQITRKREREE